MCLLFCTLQQFYVSVHTFNTYHWTVCFTFTFTWVYFMCQFLCNKIKFRNININHQLDTLYELSTDWVFHVVWVQPSEFTNSAVFSGSPGCPAVFRRTVFHMNWSMRRATNQLLTTCHWLRSCGSDGRTDSEQYSTTTRDKDNEDRLHATGNWRSTYIPILSHKWMRHRSENVLDYLLYSRANTSGENHTRRFVPPDNSPYRVNQ